MGADRTVSLTEQGHDLATRLVAGGRFASLAAVLQHGLHLVQREVEEHDARLADIRADLGRRAAEPKLTTEAMDAEIEAWRQRRDAARNSSGA